MNYSLNVRGNSCSKRDLNLMSLGRCHRCPRGLETVLREDTSRWRRCCFPHDGWGKPRAPEGRRGGRWGRCRKPRVHGRPSAPQRPWLTYLANVRRAQIRILMLANLTTSGLLHIAFEHGTSLSSQSCSNVLNNHEHDEFEETKVTLRKKLHRAKKNCLSYLQLQLQLQLDDWFDNYFKMNYEWWCLLAPF